MPTTPKKKVRTIKAWAVIDEQWFTGSSKGLDGYWVEEIGDFVRTVFTSKRSAQHFKSKLGYKEEKVIPVTITYHV